MSRAKAQKIHRFSTESASSGSLLAEPRRERLNLGPERWVSLLQGLEVNRFVITGPSLPAMKQNANPFKRQHAHCRVMALAAPPQLLIQGLGPATPFAGVISKFMKGLTQKLRAGPAPMHPVLLAAFLGDRSNAGQLLYLWGGLKAIPIRAKGRQQARSQGSARSRKTFKQEAIGMLSKKRRNLFIKPLQGGDQCPHLLGERLDHHRARQHGGRILGQG